LRSSRDLGSLRIFFVGIHVSLLLHLEASGSKDVCHLGLRWVTAPVLSQNLVLIVDEVVLLTSDDSEVGSSLLAETKWDLQLLEFVEILRV
jgi:hypothetical protein